MTGTRWMQLPLPTDSEWLDLSGKRIRNTIGPDGNLERLEIEVPRLPSEAGWYRSPRTFGAVFLRDDGTWLDANGNRIDADTIPDGLIRLIDAPTEETARG